MIVVKLQRQVLLMQFLTLFSLQQIVSTIYSTVAAIGAACSETPRVFQHDSSSFYRYDFFFYFNSFYFGYSSPLYAQEIVSAG